MKQIEVTDQAAAFIEALRGNKFETLDLAKASVADSMSVLAEMLQAGRVNPYLCTHADDLLRVMFVQSEYNHVINLLASESDDSNLAKYYLKETVERGKEGEP